MKYKILRIRDHDMMIAGEKLEKAVEKYLNDGWKVSGGVVVNEEGYYCVMAQAIVKED